MKNYYDLLGVARDVSPEEIKRAFRKEIARYHPDKVQHLGPEFQEIAAVRAAELTEAYRILMDEAARQRYNEALADEGAPGAARPEPVVGRGRGSAAPEATSPGRAPEYRPPPDLPPVERRPTQERSTTDFVRKAALARLREAVAAVADAAETSISRGLDAGFSLKARGGLFRKAEPAVRLLAKIVPQVDATAIAEAWPAALGAGDPGETVCLLLLGTGLAPARDLSVAVAEQRRKARKAGPVLVPVDVRDWEALFPPEAPASVRAILQRLKEGKG